MPSSKQNGVGGRRKKRKISPEPWSVKCFTDNASEVGRIIKASGGKIERATLLRELIDEALTARRLGQIGVDESLSAVKIAQREVVGEEVAELKRMVQDLLALTKGNGTNLDKVLSGGRETFAVVFHILRTVFNIEELAQEYLARPALEEKGEDEKAISENFAEAEKAWTAEAHNVIEAVRSQLSQAGA